MRICDSWCEHVECNKVRKDCMHPIEDRSFMDWNDCQPNEITIFGQCRLCKCKRYYTHFSFCVKCFTETIDRMNQGKVLLKPRLH